MVDYSSMTPFTFTRWKKAKNQVQFMRIKEAYRSMWLKNVPGKKAPPATLDRIIQKASGKGMSNGVTPLKADWMRSVVMVKYSMGCEKREQ